MTVNIGTDNPLQQCRLIRLLFWSGSTLLAIVPITFGTHPQTVKTDCWNFRIVITRFCCVLMFRMFTVFATHQNMLINQTCKTQTVFGEIVNRVHGYTTTGQRQSLHVTSLSSSQCNNTLLRQHVQRHWVNSLSNKNMHFKKNSYLGHIIIWAASWQNQQNDCAPSKDSDQPGQPPSLKSSLCAQWVAQDPSCFHTDSEDCQTRRVPRLYVFAGHTCHFVGFIISKSCRQSQAHELLHAVIFT